MRRGFVCTCMMNSSIDRVVLFSTFALYGCEMSVVVMIQNLGCSQGKRAGDKLVIVFMMYLRSRRLVSTLTHISGYLLLHDKNERETRLYTLATAIEYLQEAFPPRFCSTS